MSRTTTTEVKGTTLAEGGSCCQVRHDASRTRADTAKVAKHADPRAETPSTSKGTCCCGSTESRNAR